MLSLLYGILKYTTGDGCPFAFGVAITYIGHNSMHQVFPLLYSILKYKTGDEHPFVLGVRLFPPAIKFYIEKFS